MGVCHIRGKCLAIVRPISEILLVWHMREGFTAISNTFQLLATLAGNLQIVPNGVQLAYKFDSSATCLHPVQNPQIPRQKLATCIQVWFFSNSFASLKTKLERNLQETCKKLVKNFTSSLPSYIHKNIRKYIETIQSHSETSFKTKTCKKLARSCKKLVKKLLKFCTKLHYTKQIPANK